MPIEKGWKPYNESIYDDVKVRLVAKTKELISGDPLNEDTFIGPMISEKEATRLHGWIQSAVASTASREAATRPVFAQNAGSFTISIVAVHA